MNDVKKFSFFASYARAIQLLDDKSTGQLLKAMCAYAFEDKEPDGLSKSLEPIWELIKPNLEISVKRAKYGQKGGRQTNDLLKQK